MKEEARDVKEGIKELIEHKNISTDPWGV